MVLSNPTPYATRFQTMTAALSHWATKAPHRVWLAERSGEGWRTVTFREAHEQVEAIAGALAAMGVVRLEPLLILANNGIDHALISYAAMSQRMPIAPVSPQYGLKGANPGPAGAWPAGCSSRPASTPTTPTCSPRACCSRASPACR